MNPKINFFNSLTTLDDAKLSSGTGNLNNIIQVINTVITAALGLLTAGVVILSIFIAYKFFTADTNDKRNNAKQQLIYAIIGIVVLVALMIFAPNVTSLVKNALGGK